MNSNFIKKQTNNKKATRMDTKNIPLYLDKEAV